MKITRLYTGPDQESHFEDIDLPLREKGDLVRMSDVTKATGISYREADKNYRSDWHTAPHRQFVIVLGGVLEIEIGNGTIRRFGPGEVLLAEDTRGKGHLTRTVGNEPRRSLVVTLE